MYCVYLTVYKGKKLPKRYIGSTTIKRLQSGYKGSVKSKKYSDVFKEEISINYHLFKTRILKTFDTQKEAIEFELYLHKKYDVVKSEKYMNLSLACPNGFFGRNVSHENHPRYGKLHTKETKEMISNKVKKAYDEGRLSCDHLKNLDYSGKNNPFYGMKHSLETKQKMSKPKKYVPRWECHHCNKLFDGGNFKQHMKRHGYNDEEIIEMKTKMNLIKHDGWEPPTHADNVGLLAKVFDE